MKVIERFQEVELVVTKDSEQLTLDHMAGRLFRAVHSGDGSLTLTLVPDNLGMQYRDVSHINKMIQDADDQMKK